MEIFYIIFVLIISGAIFFNVFLYFYNEKINTLQKEIVTLFNERRDLIPSFYEITRDYITKHDEVFLSILDLRKKSLLENDEDFFQKINNEVIMHHEINFIFKVANKHPKIQKDSKFLLIRDLFLENSDKIGKKINIYKAVSVSFNKLLRFKNLTIIGIFLNISEKDEI